MYFSRQLWSDGSERRGPEEKRNPGNNVNLESVVEWASQKSLPNQGREDYAGYYHQDVINTGKMNLMKFISSFLMVSEALYQFTSHSKQFRSVVSK